MGAKKRFPACLIISLLFFLLIPAIGYCETGRLRVVYTEWFPYTYKESGQAAGFEIEIFKSVLKTMNIEAIFLKFPWRRCLKNLETGDGDALVSLLKTPERELYAHFPATHISISKTVFLATADSDVKFSGPLEDMRGYRIGTLMGFSYGEAFDKATDLKRDDVSDTSTLIRKLLTGRNDLCVENIIVAKAYASKMGVLDKVRFLDPPIHVQKLYVGFSKANGLKILSDDFSAHLADFKASEPYRAILRKYGVDPSEMIPEH